MRERTARILFLLGMFVSFPAILAALFVFVGPTPARHAPAARPSRTGAVAPARPAPPRSPARAAAARGPSASRDPIQRHLPTAAAARPGGPEPAALGGPAVSELATLKKELRQEISSLKDDQGAMIDALAQALTQVSPQEAAVHLKGMDAASVARALSQLGETRRQQILACLPAATAREVRLRLAPTPPQ